MIIKNLTKSFDKRILFQDFSCTFSTGLVEIRGKSGCGKSTLLKIIIGSESYDSGEILDVSENFSYYGKEKYLIDDISILENLEFFNVDNNFDLELFYSLIEILNCKKLLDKPLYLLSGGERAKVSIAFSFAKYADFYVFDEPFANIDTKSKEDLANFIVEFKNNHLVLLTNHSDNSNLLNANYLIEFKDNNAFFYTKNESNVVLEKISKRKKVNVFKLFYKTFILENKFELLVKSFLFLGSALSLLFTLTYSNLNSDFKNSMIANNLDGFNYHQIYTHNKSEMSSDFYSAQLEKYEILNLDNNINPITIVTSNLVDNDKVLCIDKNKKIINENQKIFVENETFNVELITNINPEIKNTLTYNIKTLIDSNSSTIFFSNTRFLDSIIYNKNNNFFQLEKDATPMFHHLPDIEAHYDREFLDKSFYVSTNNSFNMTFNKQEKRYFSGPLYFKDDVKIGSINTEEPGPSTRLIISKNINQKLTKEIIIGIETYKDLLFHLKENYYIAISNKDAAKINQNYFQLDREIKYSDSFQVTNSMISFIAFVVFTISLSLLIIATKDKALKRNINFKHCLNLNGYKNKYKFTLYSVIISKICVVFAIFTSIYVFVLLPYVNFINMDLVYDIPIIDGAVSTTLYYYSNQPLNNYFDHITSPIPFHTINWYFLLFILLNALYFISDSIIIEKANKGYLKLKNKNF